MTAAITVAPPDPGLLLSLGETLAATMADTIASDMCLALHQRAFQAAQARLRRINADFTRMVNELNRNYNHSEAVMAQLYIEGCREEVLGCYLAVHRAFATTAEGRAKVTALVDSLLQETVARISRPPSAPTPALPTAGEGAAPVPLDRTAKRKLSKSS